MCLCVFLLGFILPGTLCFRDLVDYFLSHVREVLSYYLFKYFLRSFLSLFSFWDPYNENVGAFNVIPEVCWAVFMLFILFYMFCFVAVISTLQSSRSFICSSASVMMLLIPSSVLFICLFFNSLVNISCIFSIFASILFLRSWIIFTIINPFSERLPISTSFSCFSGVFILSLHLGHNFLLFHAD